MLVSIIIPTYKPAAYIYECLDSLSRQTLDSSLFEIIIILNGCDGPYREMINKYVETTGLKPHVRLVQTDVPGVSNARNIGIGMAGGEYMVFIDDDDWVSDKYLANLLAQATPDSLVMANVVQVDEESRENLPHYLTRAYKKCSSLGRLNFLNARSFLSSACVKLIPRGVISNDRFDTSLALGEDSLFMFQVSRRVKNIKLATADTVYYVRKRSSSASHKDYSYSYRARLALGLVWRYTKIYFSCMSGYSFPLYLTRVAATVRKLFQKKYKK